MNQCKYPLIMKNVTIICFIFIGIHGENNDNDNYQRLSQLPSKFCPLTFITNTVKTNKKRFLNIYEINIS